jgi:predicted nucleic acid-binding protein
LTKPLTFDTTPVIYIIRASLADTLGRLQNRKLLPESVHEELMVGEARGKPEAAVIRELVQESAFTLTRPRSTLLVNRLMKIAVEDENKPLHRAEALAIAKELDGILIADDHAARSTAKLMQVECHGTGYLLGMMYQQGEIPKDEAIRKLTEMRKAGWRLSEDYYHTIHDYLRKPANKTSNK